MPFAGAAPRATLDPSSNAALIKFPGGEGLEARGASSPLARTQIMTLPQLAARLAGGFTRPARSADMYRKNAVEFPPGAKEMR